MRVSFDSTCTRFSVRPSSHLTPEMPVANCFYTCACFSIQPPTCNWFISANIALGREHQKLANYAQVKVVGSPPSPLGGRLCSIFIKRELRDGSVESFVEFFCIWIFSNSRAFERLCVVGTVKCSDIRTVVHSSISVLSNQCSNIRTVEYSNVWI